MRIRILIKDVRKEKHMTLSCLARKSGISTSHLSDIENNKKTPSILVMVLAAKALEVPITDLYKIKW